MELADVVRIMNMGPESIAEWHDVADGVLVITSEGAQTLIDPDGETHAIYPRREVPVKAEPVAKPVKRTKKA